MIKRNQHHLNKLNILTDAIALLFSYLLASWLWLDVISNTSGNMASLENLNGVVFLIALGYAAWTVFLLMLLSVYHTSRLRNRSWRYGTILAGNTFAVAVAAATLYVFRLQEFSRGVLGLYYLFSCTLLIGKRYILLCCLRAVRARGYNLKHILLVGSGSLAEQYTQCVTESPSLGLRIDAQLIPDGGLMEELERRLYGDDIDEVVLALSTDQLQYTTQVIATCEKCGTKISVIPFYNDIIPANPTIDKVGSVKLIRLRTTPLDAPFSAFLKRSFDVVVSALLLIVLSPLMAGIALAVRLSSPGPIIFRQERIGLNKKTFMMLKFRSMRVNGEQDTAWSQASDSRRTKVGGFLRKTSLDELPQLWNVLKGDMSLVGPRPEIPAFVEQFRETVPLYMVKHQVRPGMTGWAQINGYRGDTSIPDRIKHDLWYIDNWSFGLDLQILFRTALGGMVNKEKLPRQSTREK